jgi:hypothetical protein
MTVAEIIVKTLESMQPTYPQLDEKQLEGFAEMRGYLENG